MNIANPPLHYKFCRLVCGQFVGNADFHGHSITFEFLQTIVAIRPEYIKAVGTKITLIPSIEVPIEAVMVHAFLMN